MKSAADRPVSGPLLRDGRGTVASGLHSAEAKEDSNELPLIRIGYKHQKHCCKIINQNGLRSLNVYTMELLSKQCLYAAAHIKHIT